MRGRCLRVDELTGFVYFFSVLVQEDYPEENRLWVQSQNIRFLVSAAEPYSLIALCQPLTNIPLAQQFGIPGHKEAPMPPATIEAALLAVLDKNNHPMLIHCNKGKVSARCSFDAMMVFTVDGTAPNWLSRRLLAKAAKLVPGRYNSRVSWNPVVSYVANHLIPQNLPSDIVDTHLPKTE